MQTSDIMIPDDMSKAQDLMIQMNLSSLGCAQRIKMKVSMVSWNASSLLV